MQPERFATDDVGGVVAPVDDVAAVVVHVDGDGLVCLPLAHGRDGAALGVHLVHVPLVGVVDDDEVVLGEVP